MGMWEFQEWEPDRYCAECGCWLHAYMERFATLAGDICELCYERILENDQISA